MEIILSILALSVSVFSFVFTFYTFFWTANRDKKRDTLEAYNRLQHEVFDKLNTYMPSEIRDICIDKKSEQYKTVSNYLARIEHFCVGLNEKIYDRNTFYALAHGYFDGYQLRRRIEPIIESKNSGKNTPELFYNDTLSVLAWMDKRYQKKSRCNF